MAGRLASSLATTSAMTSCLRSGPRYNFGRSTWRLCGFDRRRHRGNERRPGTPRLFNLHSGDRKVYPSVCSTSTDWPAPLALGCHRRPVRSRDSACHDCSRSGIDDGEPHFKQRIERVQPFKPATFGTHVESTAEAGARATGGGDLAMEPMHPSGRAQVTRHGAAHRDDPPRWAYHGPVHSWTR